MQAAMQYWVNSEAGRYNYNAPGPSNAYSHFTQVLLFLIRMCILHMHLMDTYLAAEVQI